MTCWAAGLLIIQFALLQGSCATGTDNTNLKPRVGMIFDTLEDVEKFYKFYAHKTGFSVRVGQHKKKNEETLFK